MPRSLCCAACWLCWPWLLWLLPALPYLASRPHPSSPPPAPPPHLPSLCSSLGQFQGLLEYKAGALPVPDVLITAVRRLGWGLPLGLPPLPLLLLQLGAVALLVGGERAARLRTG